MSKSTLLVAGILLAGTVWYFSVSDSPPRSVDYSSDVKPIINKHCISCHGGVKKKGGLSLLFEEEAFAKTESGKPAIVRGNAAASELILRLTTHDTEERMPYKAPPLSKEEIATLTQWINEGAHWGTHWAYSLPESVTVPKPGLIASLFDWFKPGYTSAIDYFVKANLDKKGLSFSAEAAREVLIRRVYLDITGLPPTPEQAKEFLTDTSDDAYEKLVDQLLKSPRYGEKWASWWLDLARYSDTKGYERDGGREIWAYRDWVINAFNDDKPFDQFTIEQLAGDLLPNSTRDQLIATAFHRNTQTNDEGGTDNEEFRVAAVLDRVNTTYQVWLSTTFECVQCHSHTYDPIRHDEFYKSYAFFNNSRDEDTYGDHPRLRFYNRESQPAIDSIKSWILAHGTADDWKSSDKYLQTLEPKIHGQGADSLVNAAIADTKWLGPRNNSIARFRKVDLNDKSVLYLNYGHSAPGGIMEIHAGNPEGPLLLRHQFAETRGYTLILLPIASISGTHDLYFTFRNPQLDPNQSVCMIEWFSFRKPVPGQQAPGYEQIRTTWLRLLNQNPPSVPIMIENPLDLHRKTYVFERGNWMMPGKEVTPEVPGYINAFPKGAPKNRLGLAQWIANKENPLTSRTLVNRIWAQLFGRGLVEPLGDMGSQSEPPVQRELLDWLALEFTGPMKWSLKSLIREYVLSATYRQSSVADAGLLKTDPHNLYFARGPRFRLSAEQIRDQALCVSGLLNDKMLGKSVMPYQPSGVWQVVYNGGSWKTGADGDQHRRAVYTYLRRTSPYPSFISFDATSREVCSVDRIRTNTPLQALTTLNDSVYVEAANHLARQMIRIGGNDLDKNLETGFQLLLMQKIPGGKKQVLEALYRKAYAYYSKEPEETRRFLGLKEPPGKAAFHEAALSVVAGAMLNLDEFLTKS